MPNSYFNGLQSWLDAALSLLYPEVCQVCGQTRATAAEGFVCARCREDVHWIQPPYCDRCGLPFEGHLTTRFECANCRELKLHFEIARAAVAALGTVRDIIHRYKYQGALWFEPFLAQLLLSKAVPALQTDRWDLIVPVPLHPRKRSERQFNQAERLARRLSRATYIPLNARAIRRVVWTRSQTQLSAAERAANVRNAFVARDHLSLQDKNIVLVDDVLTTGATTNACARVLKEAGAARVCVWTVARGLLH